MKAEELRIGNYIIYEATTHIVSAIGRSGIYSWWVKDGEPVIEYCLKYAGGVQVEDPYFDQINNYEPMLITEEWLLKLGFEKSTLDEDNTWLNLRYRYLNFSSDESVEFKKVYLTVNKMDIICEHVHELQNLYFALTGEELTLKEQL